MDREDEDIMEPDGQDLVDEDGNTVFYSMRGVVFDIFQASAAEAGQEAYSVKNSAVKTTTGSK